ncbi:MFS transporter [Microbacterium sp. T2.11-28]|uniref:MFS transporter n=1 Tax=Microbacterium sp. T2.11-28 TaxID=3041169 RepID=UPI0024775747|nr:MFS transporter [Microbacterium sp. T2.11-28]CAI9393079.1 Enterobactin exporter EntS [Microbacterium sp. T2.11-28]
MTSGAGTRDRWRAVRPLGHRDFRMLFTAVVLSVFAAGMWAVVMVYAVIDTGGGPLALSLVAAANAVGLLACAIPGGIVADRVSRRLVLRAIETVNVLAIASVVVAGWLGALTVPHLTIVSFLLGGGAGFFFPAYSAVLPRILPQAQLLAANGLESAIRPALQQAAGPAAAGILLAALLPAQAAVVILLAHAGALVVLLFLRPEPVAAQGDGHGEPAGEKAEGSAAAGVRGILRDLREAVVFTLRTPWLLWTLLFATLWVLFTVGPETVLLPFVTAERFGDDPRLFGFLLAFFGAGGVVGSLFVSSLPLPRRYLSAMTLVWGFSTLPYIAIGLTQSYAVMAISCALAGFGFSYGNVIWGTLLQRRVPRHMLGRISSLDFFVSLALMPLSMAIAGPVAQVVPLSVIFVVAGIVPFLISFAVLALARMPQDEIAHPLKDD